MPDDIDHPVLGKLMWSKDFTSLESQVEFRSGYPINLRLLLPLGMVPTGNLVELLSGGVAVLEWAKRTEIQCQDKTAAELLELYNDMWAPDDATTPMTRAEFLSKITPTSLVRENDGSGYFYWADGNLFRRHWIEVRFDTNLEVTEIGLAG